MLSSSSTIRRLGIGSIGANEGRSQEPEVTIEETGTGISICLLTTTCQDRCAVSFKQSTRFFQLAHLNIAVPVAQIGRENQIVLLTRLFLLRNGQLNRNSRSFSETAAHVDCTTMVANNLIDN